MEGGSIAGIIIGVALLIVLLVLWNSVVVISQSEAAIVERLGRFNRILKPGLNFLCPLVDSLRAFTWRRTYVDVSGRVVDEIVTSTRIDLREGLFSFLQAELFTKDSVLLQLQTFMLYRITDGRRAIYEVDDLAAAISDTAQSALKRIFGSLTFTEALAGQDLINELMKRSVSQTYEKWGVRVERIEIRSMTPKAASTTANAMKQQMIAERKRRAEFIEAEGNKAATRLKSEATKIIKANLGVAEQEALRKRSEGEAAAKVELARAEKAALDTIADAIGADGCSQTDYMLAKRYNELLRAVPTSIERQTVYLPYEVASISGLVGQLPSVFGRKAARLQQIQEVGSSSGDMRLVPGRRAGGGFSELD